MCPHSPGSAPIAGSIASSSTSRLEEQRLEGVKEHGVGGWAWVMGMDDGPARTVLRRARCRRRRSPMYLPPILPLRAGGALAARWSPLVDARTLGLAGRDRRRSSATLAKTARWRGECRTHKLYFAIRFSDGAARDRRSTGIDRRRGDETGDRHRPTGESSAERTDPTRSKRRLAGSFLHSQYECASVFGR